MSHEGRVRMGVFLPSFTGEVADALVAEGQPDLAKQVFDLKVWGRCGCGDDFCASFYTGPKPTRPWRDYGEHTNVAPGVSAGMVVLDVVGGLIRYVEVLDRPDVKKVVETLPIASTSESPDS